MVKFFKFINFVFILLLSFYFVNSTDYVNFPIYYADEIQPSYYLVYNIINPGYSMRLNPGPSDPSPYDFDYSISGVGNVLTTNKCIVESVSQTLIDVNFDNTLYNSYFRTPISTPVNYQQILDNNYYMRNKVEYMLKDSALNPVSSSIYTANDNLLVGPEGIVPSPSYSYTGSEEYLTPGQTYTVWIKVTPIDMKCDFNGNTNLEIYEYQSSGWIQLIGITPIIAPSEPLPVITSFIANPGITIYEGQDLYFTWESTDAISCKLFKGLTQLTSATSSLGYQVTDLPSPGSSASYKLLCFNSLGDSTFQSITITVNPMSYNWHESSWSTCHDTICNAETITNFVSGTKSRTVSCKNSLNEVVLDSFCEANSPKPLESGPCYASCDFDFDLVGNGDDLCKNLKWNIEGHTAINKEQYQGCPYEYSATCDSPSGDISFDGTHVRYISGEFGKELFFSLSSPNGGEQKVNNAWYNNDNINYIPTSPGFYSGNDGNGEWRGYCELTLNANPSTYCTIEGKEDLVRVGESKKYYKYKKILKREKYADDFGAILGYSISSTSQECTLGGQVLSAIPPEYIYSNVFVLSGSESDNLIRDPVTGKLKSNDEITIGKLSCDSINDECSLKVNSTSMVNLNLATIAQSRTAEIKIIKDGSNIRNDTIDISLIAMQAHKIQRFTNSTNAESFIAKSYDVMTKFDITKNLTYNPVTNKTTVRILMNNIAESDKKNLTIYMLVDKEIANSLENISNIEKGAAEFFVVDKDPIIGWYFNESGSDEEIGYEVPGESEGGTIIITQTPILYNEGELIINYRETDCSAGELTLFELDNLIDSKVYAPGSSQVYKVCLTHLDSNVNLALGSGIQSIDVMSYTNAQNASSNPNELTTKITLSTDNSSLYFDVRVQKENPSGNYSCIGSLDVVNQSSLFGDCGYNEDARVWIHLGADYNAPETTIYYPALAHILKVTLTAFEPIWESGVKNLSYRILEDNESVTTVEGNSVSFMVTCPNDWNCKKTVEYYSYDNAGNKEENKTRELLLIDKGSACQADCTAKPSPNRYLKECTNLNSCEFYQFNQFGLNDGGDYVANQCDYLAIGSWATYNETHEILCPKGPFRESKFTIERVNVIDQSNCENVLKTPYPVIFDGENIIMNVISCINYEE